MKQEFFCFFFQSNTVGVQAVERKPIPPTVEGRSPESSGMEEGSKRDGWGRKKMELSGGLVSI